MAVSGKFARRTYLFRRYIAQENNFHIIFVFWIILLHDNYGEKSGILNPKYSGLALTIQEM